MWCANCHADVAAEVTPDNQRVRCACCGREIATAQGGRTVLKTQQARELLERWSNERLLDPYGPILNVKSPLSKEAAPQKTFAPHSDSPPPPDSPESRTESKPRIRIDDSHPLPGSAQPVQQPSSVSRIVRTESAVTQRNDPADDRTPTEVTPEPPSASTAVVHPAHSGRAAGPHFDVQRTDHHEPQRTTHWMAFVGPLLAYLGVGGLTVGATLVLWGYFGEADAYMSTGWLMTVAGQMLLFLGIITMVSGGMEQTTEEVARRIESLSERLIRIEQASRGHALRGPLGDQSRKSRVPNKEVRGQTEPERQQRAVAGAPARISGLSTPDSLTADPQTPRSKTPAP